MFNGEDKLMTKPIGEDNKDNHRFKYKVYKVVNVMTGEVSRLAGAGMDLPYEPLRNLPLGGIWLGKTERYERIM